MTPETQPRSNEGDDYNDELEHDPPVLPDPRKPDDPLRRDRPERRQGPGRGPGPINPPDYERPVEIDNDPDQPTPLDPSRRRRDPPRRWRDVPQGNGTKPSSSPEREA